MPIKVIVSQSVDYHKVIEYYNARKPAGEHPLEILDRAEGGFKIKYDREKPSYNPNDHIRQLRWSRGKLISMGNIGFTEQQELLLHEALLSVLVGGVILEL
jgi:hypothetical protein